MSTGAHNQSRHTEERLTEPERANIWTALAQYPRDTIHTSARIGIRKYVGWHPKMKTRNESLLRHRLALRISVVTQEGRKSKDNHQLALTFLP